MQDQIQGWANSLGLRPEQVQTGLNTLMQFLQSRVPAPVWQQLVSRVPQVQSWVADAITMSQPAVRAASGALGGAGNDLSQLFAELKKAGFTPERAMQFVPAVLEQIKAQAGPELYQKLAGAVPGLGAGRGAEGLGKIADAASGLLGKFLK